MTNTPQPSTTRGRPRTGLHYTVKDAGIIAAIYLASSLAVPVMYAERFNDVAWGVSVLGFVGAPLLAGVVRGKPSPPASLAAGILVLACPLIYLLTELLPHRAELMRDAFFLGSASTLTFVTGGWTADAVRARRWSSVLTAVSLSIAATGSIAIMISIFPYLE